MTRSMKTSELSGAALDWAVEIASGGHPQWNTEWEMFYAANGDEMSYSTDWAQGGPIIEREQINLFCRKGSKAAQGLAWLAYGSTFESEGPTPLTASMRCYVANKLGNIVAIPMELINYV